MGPKRRKDFAVPAFSTGIDLAAAGHGGVLPTFITPVPMAPAAPNVAARLAGVPPALGGIVFPGTPGLPEAEGGEMPPDELILKFTDHCSFGINQCGVRYLKEPGESSTGSPSKQTGEFPGQPQEAQQQPTTASTSAGGSQERDDPSEGDQLATKPQRRRKGSQKDEVTWKLLESHWNKHGESLTLRGEDFLQNFTSEYQQQYLDKGSQGSVWLYKDFVFKRIAVSKPRDISEHDALPFLAEVGYALKVAYLHTHTEVGRSLLPIHGVWYLKESKATTEPAIYLAMDPHDMSCEAYQTGYMKALSHSKVKMNVIFWDPDIDSPVPQTGDVLATPLSQTTGGVGAGGYGTATGDSMTTPGSARGKAGMFTATSYDSPCIPSSGSQSNMASNASVNSGMSRNQSSRPQEFSEKQEAKITNAAAREDEMTPYTDRASYGGTADASAMKNSLTKSMSTASLSKHASCNSLMELEEAENNKEYLEFKRGLRMSAFQEEVLCILAFDVLSSLDALHRHAFLMHNDIKAANILLSKNHRGFTLVDFGCALPINEAGTVSQKIVDLVSHGNGEYKAPEAYEDFSKLVSDAAQALSETAAAGANFGGSMQSPIMSTIGSFDSVGSFAQVKAGGGSGNVPQTPTSTTTNGSSINNFNFESDGGRAIYCAKSDVYSFAALLLEFRAGRKPKKVTLDSITIAQAAQQAAQAATSTGTVDQNSARSTPKPQFSFLSPEKLTEKFENLSHPSDRVQCIVLRYEARPDHLGDSMTSATVPKQVVLRGVLDRGLDRSLALISDDGDIVPFLTKSGAQVPGANLLSVDREANFGRVDVIDPEDVRDLNSSDTFKDFLLQALTLNWELRPSAQKLLLHPFLSKAGTYRKHLKEYINHLAVNKKKVEDVTILNQVTDTSQTMPFPRQSPGSRSYLEKARLHKLTLSTAGVGSSSTGVSPTSSNPQASLRN